MRPIAPTPTPGWTPVYIPAGPEYKGIEVATDGEHVMTMWEFTAVERAAILAGANLLVRFRSPRMPPVAVAVDGVDE